MIRRQHKSAAMLETPQKGCEVRGGALAVTNQGKGVKSSHAADERIQVRRRDFITEPSAA